MATTTVQIGTLATGTKINITIGGTVRDCYILNQGKPSASGFFDPYDSSCDGTWVTMDTPPLTGQQWNSSSPATYANSSIHSYLNSTFYNSIDSNVRNSIKQVKIPYWPNSYNLPNGAANYGSSGLSCKIFLLSYAEVDSGHLGYGASAVPDGQPVSFLPNHYMDDAAAKKYSWTRTGLASTAGNAAIQARFYSSKGNGGSADVTSGAESYSDLGVRPVFILPSTFQIQVEVPNTAPSTPGAISVTPTPIMGGSSVTASWGASTDPDGDTVYYKIERSIGGGAWELVYTGQTTTSRSDTIPAGTSTVQYRVLAYDSIGDTSAYRNGTTYTVVNNTAPTTPGTFTVPALKGGAKANITWGASTDADGNLTGYRLERSTNGGSTWGQIYQGADAKYEDTITYGWTTVMYRVKAYDPYAESGYRTSSSYSVANNVAPTVPASINVPATINGGSTTKITWVASTDADGNLSGYKLERSTDAGSTWGQIYQGNVAEYTDTITFGTVSVMYRVRAYDTDDAHSGYKTSEQRTVVNNTAPATPPAINVPLSVIGGEKLTVSWTASTDSEGNLSGYKLERKVADGSWGQIYSGTNLSYPDTITKGWTTVTYRVKAYDAGGLESAYKTSDARTVDNNTAPTVVSSSPDNLGELTTEIRITYVANDVDGDVVTVIERVDGVVFRSYTAVLGQTQTFLVEGLPWMKILNGDHALTVTATDQHGKSAVITRTFTKAVYSCSISLETPLETDALITRMVMSIMRSVPTDAQIQIMVTNNALDPSPVWEDATTILLSGLNYLFENTTVANGDAFNFVFSASRGPSNVGGTILTIGGAFE